MAQTVYWEAADRAERSAGTFERMNRAFLDEQAGILSAGLRDGEPCPVCGSLSHPNPAALSPEAPSEAQLKQAKKKAQDDRKSADDASSRAGEIFGRARAARAELEKKLRALFGGELPADARKELSERLDLVGEKIAAAREAVRKEDARIRRREALGQSIPDAEFLLDTLEKTISRRAEHIGVLGEKIAEADRRLAAFDEKLEYEDKEKAAAVRDSLCSERERIRENRARAEEACRASETRIAGIDGRILGLKEKIASAGKEAELDFDRLLEAEREISGKKAEAEKRLTEVSSRLNANRTALGAFRRKESELAAAEEKLGWMKALSDTANGTLNGKEKIMLETYVLTTFFDRILARANLRLSVMSGGQYELKRREAAENNRSQSGLEIDVVDHYNDTERSVKTLSGGEAFKASLALALGLSDEIQSEAGGIRLDTLFVDEGFGSLDEESLRQAVKALAGLTESNRLVGIISHVAELKQQIGKQIVVTKDKTGGSRAEVVV